MGVVRDRNSEARLSAPKPGVFTKTVISVSANQRSNRGLIMKALVTLAALATLTTGIATPAYAASPDIYVVNFRNIEDANSTKLDGKLSTALAIAGVNAKEIVIDTSTANMWEKGAYAAFEHDIVPIFNQWVGLPGFAAVVDAQSKRVIGCVNSAFSANEMANEIRNMALASVGAAIVSKANLADDFWQGQTTTPLGQSHIIKTSVTTKTTKCPAAHNAR